MQTFQLTLHFVTIEQMGVYYDYEQASTTCTTMHVCLLRLRTGVYYEYKRLSTSTTNGCLHVRQLQMGDDCELTVYYKLAMTVN